MDVKNKLKHLMTENNISFSTVAKSTGLSASTINLWANDKYIGNNQRIADKINNYILRELEAEQNSNKNVSFIQLSTSRYVQEIARLCHTKGDLGVCYGDAGLGKTYAVKKYANDYPDAILIEVDCSFTAKSTLLEIHKKLCLSAKGSIYSLMCEIVAELQGSGRLLIIDEAEHLPHRALELLRRIQDKTGAGLLLVGMPQLVENLRGKKNEYRQLYSRVDWGKSINNLNLSDVEKSLDAADLDVNLAPVFFKFSYGNIRTLSKLINRSKSVAKINQRQSVDSQIIGQAAQLLIV